MFKFKERKTKKRLITYKEVNNILAVDFHHRGPNRKGFELEKVWGYVLIRDRKGPEDLFDLEIWNGKKLYKYPANSLGLVYLKKDLKEILS